MIAKLSYNEGVGSGATASLVAGPWCSPSGGSGGNIAEKQSFLCLEGE